MENKEAKKMIICATCGAEFDASLVRCPYCGGGYAPAEEDEYMDRLDDNRKELDSHKADGDKSLKKQLSKSIGLVIIIIAAIILLIAGSFCLARRSESHKAEQQKQEFLSNQGIVTD